MKTITVNTSEREEMIDITRKVQETVSSLDISDGIVICYIPHTTAGITINENADPDVKRDLLYKLKKEIPQQDGYYHAEGNSDAHLKASLFGFSENIIIKNGKLVLGTWQSIYFCEFDGPRKRKVHIKVTSSD